VNLKECEWNQLFSNLRNFRGILMEGFRKARRNVRQGRYLKGEILIQDLLNVKCSCVLNSDCRTWNNENLRLEPSRTSAKKQECLKPELINLKQTVKKYVGGLIMQVVQDITSCWLVYRYACQQALCLRRHVSSATPLWECDILH